MGAVDFDPGRGNFNLTRSGSDDIFVFKLSRFQPTNVGGTTSFLGDGSVSTNGSFFLPADSLSPSPSALRRGVPSRTHRLEASSERPGTTAARKKRPTSARID